MRVAIMQPYFLPYLGYWQLLDAVDTLVLYDDIEYTKKGWINRNRLLFGEKIAYITVPLARGSDFATIGERALAQSWPTARARMLRTVAQHYRDRPNFAAGFALLERIVHEPTHDLFAFLHAAIAQVTQELALDTRIRVSSAIGDFRALRGADKVMAICQALGADGYVNPPGGRGLYDPAAFAAAGIDLRFLEPALPPYDQRRPDFVPGLSVMDMLMSVPPGPERARQCAAYTLA